MSLSIRFKLIAITLIGTSLLISSGRAFAVWGADLPNEIHRPALDWLDNFSSTADIIAVGNIEDAIGQCNQVVGVNAYCVVGIGPQSGNEPFGIYRSKTRVLGLPGAAPIIAQPDSASVYITNNTSRVAVENLDLKGINSGTNWSGGIEVSGQYIRDILIRNNYIHNFVSSNSANGIVVLGSGNTNRKRISQITIDNNLIQDMRTGSAESIAVNGNVASWVISNNTVERVNNIAIDAIGGEGTVEPEIVNGRILPHRFDVARVGWIENNIVRNMSTRRNPAYGNKRTWTGAIYVDGGQRISITGNQVYNTPWAYDIGTENCVFSSDITMRYNTASGSFFGDLRLGGYRPGGYLQPGSTVNCDPRTSNDTVEGHGYVRELTIAENQFNSVNSRRGYVYIEYRTTRAIVAQEGVAAVRAQGNGNAPGDGNAIRITE